MSCTIEFRHRAIRVTRSDFPWAHKHPTSRFILFAEAGSNNCVDMDGKIARSWMAIAMGDYSHVMTQVTERAVYCEEGGITLRARRGFKPESYIARMRTVLDAAVEEAPGANWLPFVRDPLAVAEALELGARVTEWVQPQFGTGAYFPIQRLPEYFALAERLIRARKSSAPVLADIRDPYIERVSNREGLIMDLYGAIASG